MELRQFIDYYKLELFICASLLTAIIIVTAYSYVKSKLLDKYVEFDDEPIASSPKENQLYIVDDGIKEKVFYTPNGALIYTTALFNKRGKYPKIYFCENDVKTEITANCLRRAIHNKNAFRYID